MNTHGIPIDSAQALYQAGMLKAEDYITPARKMAGLFNHEGDTFFLSEDSPEIVVKVENNFYLMDANYKIHALERQQ